ncbi:MAG TPA: VOC family protein [Bryobacteraceae bacterium]|jgi:PhnB protein|nr:VOC family protein [Bryobacteraceae bacterium]
MAQLNPYLNFNGQCEAAFKFYEQCFGGKDLMLMKFGESPMAGDTPPEWRDKIMHAHLNIGQSALLGSDAPPDRFQKPQGFYVSYSLNDPAEAERVFKTLSENGQVQMPLQQTFWAVRFGMVADRFGIQWMINCEKAA